MRMQAELCGLIAMNALLFVTKAGNRPGKAPKGRLVILVPEKALGGAVRAQGCFQGFTQLLKVDWESGSLT